MENLKTELRLINATIAKEMLKRNQRNRTLKIKDVKYLSDQMKNNQWLFDGQPIRFTEDGRLLDGQHRLNAIIESNTEQKFLVIKGIKSESFKVMDTGRTRTGADVFSINGISNSTTIAATVRFIISFKRNSLTINKSKITNTDLLNWYEKNKNISDIVKNAFVMKNEFSNVLTATQIAGFHFLFAKKNVIEAENFIYKLCTGLGVENTNPIFLLRKKLIQDKINVAKLPTNEKFAFIVKTWNNYRLNKDVKILKWNSSNEKFPEII
jgi:hypothetical protein